MKFKGEIYKYKLKILRMMITNARVVSRGGLEKGERGKNE